MTITENLLDAIEEYAHRTEVECHVCRCAGCTSEKTALRTLLLRLHSYILWEANARGSG